jgi:hypothetical protein
MSASLIKEFEWIRGGSEPTMAPTNVFQGELYFIGR